MSPVHLKRRISTDARQMLFPPLRAGVTTRAPTSAPDSIRSRCAVSRPDELLLLAEHVAGGETRGWGRARTGERLIIRARSDSGSPCSLELTLRVPFDPIESSMFGRLTTRPVETRRDVASFNGIKKYMIERERERERERKLPMCEYYLRAYLACTRD